MYTYIYIYLYEGSVKNQYVHERTHTTPHTHTLSDRLVQHYLRLQDAFTQGLRC